MPWIRRVRLDHFEVPIEDRVVRVGLTDGVAEFEDADGEVYMDGWSTLDDLVRGLERHVGLPREPATAAAEEAIRRWREHLGPDHRFEYYRDT